MDQNILSFGELLWDIMPEQTILGGAPFNFAFRVNSLGDNSLFVSRLGQDKLADEARATVAKLGVNTALLQTDDKHPTGTVDVSFDENHMPDYIINTDVAFDFIELTDELIIAAETADCLCFGILIQRAPASQKTLQQLLDYSPDSLKFLDVNLRKDCYSVETIKWSLQQADVLKLNDDEVVRLCKILNLGFRTIKEFCAFAVSTWNLQYCLVTCGEKGAFARSADGMDFYEPGYQIELADSLGSGDAFSAGFVHKILNGTDAGLACHFANMLGALVATKPGGTTPVTQQEIDAFTNQRHQRLFHPDFV